MWSGFKRVLLWDFPRASWQYDLIVAAILVFIFLTPRSWFKDQPRIPQTYQVASVMPSAGASLVYWIEPELVPPDTPQSVLDAKVAEILKRKTGREQRVVKIEPVYDSERVLTGYMAVAKP